MIQSFNLFRSIFQIIIRKNFEIWMRRKTLKKRPETTSMINFQDFVHFRSQKEKIINNPFEQNWKKSIIMDELLALYKPHLGGIPPSAANYTKADYVLQYPLYSHPQNEDTQWNTNQQSQINKYFKMVEGLNRWEEIFEHNHIEKAAAKIEKTVLGHRKPKTVCEFQIENKKVDSKKKKKLHQHYSNQSLPGFTNLLRTSEENLNSQKQEVQRLQKLAIKHYGLNFKENSQKGEIQFNYDEFKKKDRKLVDQFMSTLPKRGKFTKRQDQSAINSNIPMEIQLKRAYPHSTGNSPLKEMHLPKSCNSSTKRKYLRIECD